jgi:hypothetical protein
MAKMVTRKPLNVTLHVHCLLLYKTRYNRSNGVTRTSGRKAKLKGVFLQLLALNTPKYQTAIKSALRD